ncbi:hypothetical protein CONLIGDRAFT_363553 [Coniochaeta ligniaria NRRL 30616]|uniref:Trichothecene 3-O-acetyltransferase n=1 Tax=Coniochaeta ligniaria NRRL 30616 TaxID=1408157 RepID=A0A1J7JAJ0_9PEZI|nr:hypothetical protein CONLIGDRAFT_363553 [Coniochaeta ligniaria NRRL 30616]
MAGNTSREDMAPAEPSNSSTLKQPSKVAETGKLYRRVQRLQLSPIEHTISRGYVRVHLCFPFEGDASTKKEAVLRLQRAHEVTLNRWPFLASVIFPPNPKEPDVLEVGYPLPATAADGRLSFAVSAAGGRAWTYEQLTKWGAPPSWFEEVLTVPYGPIRPQFTMCSVMAVHANFFQGGLVLGFAFHHSVMDGSSIKQFLQVFAAACTPGWQCWSKHVQDRRSELSFLLPTAETSKKNDAVQHCEEYDLAARPYRAPKPCTTVIFEFKHSRIKELKHQVMYHLKQRGVEDWVSTTDCLCGLIWVAVMRTRAYRLPQQTEVKFTTAVDARSRVSQPLPEYMGNLIVAAMAKTTLGELIGQQYYRNIHGLGTPHERMWQAKFHEVLGSRNDIPLLSIANAALEIRKAIRRVDEEYVKRRMAISPDDSAKIRTTHAYDLTVDGATTGVDFSSWRNWLDLGFYPTSKMSFDIPGAKTHFPDFIRPGYPQAEGACILLPRRTGGPWGQDATWEVSLCLRDCEMTHLRFVTELGGWAKKIHDHDLQDIAARNGGPREFRRYQEKIMMKNWDDIGWGLENLDLNDGDAPAPKRQRRSGNASGSGEAMDLTEG